MKHVERRLAEGRFAMAVINARVPIRVGLGRRIYFVSPTVDDCDGRQHGLVARSNLLGPGKPQRRVCGRDQAILQVCFPDGMSWSGIAAETNCPEATIRSRWHRLKQSLAQDDVLREAVTD